MTTISSAHGTRPWFSATPEAFHQFFSAWESGTLPRSEWTHAAHVAVGAYLAALDSCTAFERTKSGILRYNTATGMANTDSSGYHETLTRFWNRVITSAVDRCDNPFEAVKLALNIFADRRDLARSYYSFDVVRSVEARRRWVAPDLTGPYALQLDDLSA